ncbi:hypothetical protein RJT34_23674 [Clitoria ternatea]|uniref:GDSL esterase/lipase At5g03610-like n=1 Tax=Clitoria ternatea TaxID=43366 RepID=A0AAN9FSQ2_CLITE
MDSQKLLFSFLCLPLLLILLKGLEAEGHLQREHKKLFVFGDSYVDSGNIRKGFANSWKVPYGTTFPGKPVGRFSDGRVFSDYIARYLGLKSPIPYRLRKLMPQHLKYGMNFAFGGTGVFDTFAKAPNMTTQIHLFQQLIQHKLYSPSDLTNSVALVSVAGNDYTHFAATNGSAQGFPSFIASVVNQTATNLLSIQKLGVKKIVVDGVQPLGCLPQSTTTSFFQQCNSTLNNLVVLHNNLLHQAVTKLNDKTKGQSTFIILDLFNSFMSVLDNPSTYNIKDPRKPCCVGVSSEYKCGSVGENNVQKYKVCDKPNTSFYWDLVHPSQAGWNAVYNKLQTTGALQQLRN